MFEKIIITAELSNKRLDQIITELEIVNSRNKAISLIMSGKVFINEKKIDKPGKIIKVNSILKYKKEEKDWVSRGGTKLDNALKQFNVDIRNKFVYKNDNKLSNIKSVIKKPDHDKNNHHIDTDSDNEYHLSNDNLRKARLKYFSK